MAYIPVQSEIYPLPKKVSTNILFSFSAEISLFALSFLLTVLTARYLGADGRGKFWLITNVTGILPLIFSMRFQRSVTYHLSKNNDLLGEIISYGLLVGIASAVFTAIIINGFAGFFNNLVLKNISISWSILVLLCFARYLWSLIIALIEGLFLFKAKALFMGGSFLLKCLALIFALSFLRLELDGLFLLMGSVETVVYLLIVVLFLFRAKHFDINISAFRDMLKYAMGSFPGMVSDLVTLRIDVFIVNYFSGPAEVGIYTVAVSLASMLLYLPTAVRNVVLPYIAGNQDRELTPRLSRLLLIIMSLSAILLIPLIWVLVVPVFGEEFAYSRVLFLMLLPGIIFWGVFTLLASDIEGRGHPWRVSTVSIISACSTVVLDLYLIPIWNAMGAAVVSSITYAISMLLAARVYRQVLGINISKLVGVSRDDFRSLMDLAKHFTVNIKRTRSAILRTRLEIEKNKN